MNRRGFLAAFAAGLVAPKVELLPPLQPGELVTGWFTVGVTGQYRTIRAALNAARAAGGGVVYMQAGYYEATGLLVDS
jgi:hypothetical protein